MGVHQERELVPAQYGWAFGNLSEDFRIGFSGNYFFQAGRVYVCGGSVGCYLNPLNPGSGALQVFFSGSGYKTAKTDRGRRGGLGIHGELKSNRSFFARRVRGAYR